MTGGRMVVLSNHAPGREREFNTWYGQVHVPEVMQGGRSVGCQRCRLVGTQMMAPTHWYLAIYEFEGSGKEALEGRQAASGSMDVSDALVEPHLCMVEPLGRKVVKRKSKARSRS